MKVATQKPKAVKSPVRLTDTKYEMWYCKPMNLGTIDRKGQHWYTADGMRFISSRNALDYLIRLHELGSKAEQLPEQERKKIVAQIVKPVVVIKKEKAPEISPRSFEEYVELQNNPLFQDFLKFIRTKRVLSPDRSSASSVEKHIND